MTCPTCGFVMSPFDRDCPRCIANRKSRTARISTEPPPQEESLKILHPLPVADAEPAKPHLAPSSTYCTNCGEIVMQGSNFCRRCGAPQGQYSQVPDPNANYAWFAPQGQPAYVPKEQTQAGLIVTMWLLSGAAWIAFINGNPGMGLLIDLTSTCIAVALAATAGATNKANGWVKLGIEAVGFFMSCSVAMTRRM